MTATIPIAITVNGRPRALEVAVAPHAARRPARRPRADRHEGVLPRRRVRRVHRHRRRADRRLLPGPRGRGRRGRGHHGRGARRRWPAQPAPAGVPRHAAPSSAASASPASSWRLMRSWPRIRTPTVAEMQEGLAGNLCRCAGYQQITEAVLAAAEAARPMSAHAIGGSPARVGGHRAGHRRAAVRGRHPPAGRAPREARHARLCPGPDRLDRHECRAELVPGVRLVMTAADLPQPCRASGPSSRTARSWRWARRSTTASRWPPWPRTRRTRPRRPPASSAWSTRSCRPSSPSPPPSTRPRRSSRTRPSARTIPWPGPTSSASTISAGATSTPSPASADLVVEDT